MELFPAFRFNLFVRRSEQKGFPLQSGLGNLAKLDNTIPNKKSIRNLTNFGYW